MSSQMTVVQYFIPEDKDDTDKYNAFVIYKEIDSVRIADVRSNFPLPGKYYFRFKFKFGQQEVWIDHSKEESSLPKYDNKIIMKVNRLSWGVEDKKETKKDVDNIFADSNNNNLI